ncbi:something about silencing protein 10, partial [Basidiobolus ranarum]
MARKKSRSQNSKEEPKYDGGGSSVRAINTWDDVEHDSEDEFHAERDQVLLGDESKFRRQANSSDEDDEEVFGLEGVSEDSDDSQNEEEEGDDDDDETKEAEEAEDDDTAWGRKRTSYYNADDASDEEDAKEEEKEALRLQKKHLTAMDEDDFIDEFADSLGKAGDDYSSKVSLEKDVSEDRKLIESVNQDLDLISLESGNVATETIKKVTSKLTKAQTLKLLQNESPELIELLSEFKEKLNVKEELEPIIHLAKEKGIDSSMSKAMALLEAKYQILLNYLLNTSFYFLLKSSGAPDIKEHPVIDVLVNLKTNLEKIEQLEEKLHQDLEDFIELLHSNLLDSENEKEDVEEENEEEHSVEEASISDESANEDEEVSDEQVEESEEEADFEDDFDQVNKELSTKLRKRKKADNDFGDLDIQDIESQSTKKRSLRDYVAKINQSTNKRDVRNKFSGDTDIPYKSRENRFTNTLPKIVGGGDDD